MMQFEVCCVTQVTDITILFRNEMSPSLRKVKITFKAVRHMTANFQEHIHRL